jgi:hypothetical protein
MKAISTLLFGGALALGAAGAAMAQDPPAQPQPQSQAGAAQEPGPPGWLGRLGGPGRRARGPNWRQEMLARHAAQPAGKSLNEELARLTRDFQLTPAQVEKVRPILQDHNDRIQVMLDTAPPSLTFEAFNEQVHAISRETHDRINALLTPDQIQLMQAMIQRLDNGQEHRHAPS